MRLAKRGEHLHATGTRHRRNFTHETALADARWPHHADHSAVALNCTLQQVVDGGHLPPPPDQSRLSTPDAATLFTYAQQQVGLHWFVGALDLNHLRLTESHCAINQSRRRRTEYHPTRRSDRFHPLSHPDLIADSGVTERARTDFTGDHLARVQTYPQLQLDTVAVLDLDGKPLRLVLNAQTRQAGTDRVVLQRHRRAEDSHDAVTGETADRAAVPLNHHCRTVNQIGHDLAQPLCTDLRRDVHRMHHVGEQHRHLLVLRRSADLCDRCTARVTELGVQRQLGATRPTRQSRCCHCTATAVHANIVSPLVNDVRHIAAPAPTRSSEILICRLLRGDLPASPGRIHDDADHAVVERVDWPVHADGADSGQSSENNVSSRPASLRWWRR